MMSWALVSVALMAGGVGGVGLLGSWWLLRVLREHLEHPTPTSELRAGTAVVRGRIEAQEPLRNAHGEPCALIVVELSGRGLGAGRRKVFCAPDVFVRDEAGRCGLETQGGRWQGPARVARGALASGGLLARLPEVRGMVRDLAGVTFVERSLPVGTTVLARGQVVPDASATAGYRGSSREPRLAAGAGALVLSTHARWRLAAGLLPAVVALGASSVASLVLASMAVRELVWP